MPRRKTRLKAGPASADPSLARKGRLATAAVRALFPECGPVVVFRKADGGLGFRLDVHVSSGERARLDEAYRAVTRVLGERRGRPVGPKTVQTKLLLPADTHSALKASARSSNRTMSGLAAEVIRSAIRDGSARRRGSGASAEGRGGDVPVVNLDDVLVFLRETPLLLRQLTGGLSDEDARWKPSASEFSLLENACHLRDIEREGFAVRITRLLSEPEPDLPDLDGDVLARERRYNEQDLATAVADFERARAETMRKLTALTPEQLGRAGRLEGVGRISIGELAAVMRDHDAEHRKALLSIRERILESPPAAREKAAILAVVRRFVDAFRAGDVERLLATYAEDLVKLRHGAAAETKAGLARRLAGTFAAFDCSLDVENEEILTSGQLAFARGRFRVTLKPKEGGPTEVIDRRFFEVWRKHDGRWLVARTMDSPA